MALALAVSPTWQATATRSPDGIALSYRCPRCGGWNALSVQAPPWSEPADPDVAPALGGEARWDNQEGHNHPRHAELEALRAAGALPHQDVDMVRTQLWCHRCQHGTDAVIADYDADV